MLIPSFTYFILLYKNFSIPATKNQTTVSAQSNQLHRKTDFPKNNTPHQKKKESEIVYPQFILFLSALYFSTLK